MVSLRQHLLAVLLLSGFLLLAPISGHTEEQVAIVVSSKAAAIALDDATLRAIYLKKIFLDQAGESLIPVNLPADHPLRQAFSLSVIHMGETQLRNYWNRRYFQGVSPPYVLGSQKAMVRFIAATPGAIGYVSPCFVDSSVRTVLLMTIPDIRSDALESCPPSPDA